MTHASQPKPHTLPSPSSIPSAPGLYTWHERLGGEEHDVEISYEQASSGEIGRSLLCHSLTDFEDLASCGAWSYCEPNPTPHVSPSDLAALAGSEGWTQGFPSRTGGYLWRLRPEDPACRIDIRDATLKNGQLDRLLTSHCHSAAEEFATLRSCGEWARPDSLRDYVH